MRKCIFVFSVCVFVPMCAFQKTESISISLPDKDRDERDEPLTPSPMTYSDLEVLDILAQQVEECSLVNDSEVQSASVDRSTTNSVPLQRSLVSALYRKRRKELQTALTDLAVRDPLSIHASFDESDERMKRKRLMCVSAVDTTFVQIGRAHV